MGGNRNKRSAPEPYPALLGGDLGPWEPLRQEQIRHRRAAYMKQEQLRMRRDAHDEARAEGEPEAEEEPEEEIIDTSLQLHNVGNL